MIVLLNQKYEMFPTEEQKETLDRCLDRDHNASLNILQKALEELFVAN